MDIRWEDGEEISTPIDLQQRIIERMRFEKELEAAQKIQKAKKAKASASKGGKHFEGLEENDFSNSVSKTTWRGRGQLGGAVALRLKSKQFKFNSWAVLRKPEVSWLDVTRQKQPDIKLQSKFYARVEEADFFYGVLTPAPDPSGTEAGDWHALMAWLDKPENDSWLNKQCSSHGLYLCDLSKQGFNGTLEAKDGQWVQRGQDEKETAVVSLSAFLVAAGKSAAVDLRIEKRLAKGDAIEKKQSIAGDIATLFENLMPVYAAAAAR
ncbi:hypothetical protein [Desulfosarcina alkanivorans]|nr:hypothetical protein [Desulfosarcina alkanivorans]